MTLISSMAFVAGVSCVILGWVLHALHHGYERRVADLLVVGAVLVSVALAMRVEGAMLSLHASSRSNSTSFARRALASAMYVIAITFADLLLLWMLLLVDLVLL